MRSKLAGYSPWCGKLSTVKANPYPTPGESLSRLRRAWADSARFSVDLPLDGPLPAREDAG